MRWRSGLLSLILLLIVAAVVILLAESDPSVGDYALLGGIAADPARYDGRHVSLTGSVTRAPGSLPKGAPDGFVLGDGDGARVLVLWESARLDDVVAGATVEVVGTVRAPEPVADERFPEEPPITPTELLGRTDSWAFVEAQRVAVVG